MRHCWSAAASAARVSGALRTVGAILYSEWQCVPVWRALLQGRMAMGVSSERAKAPVAPVAPVVAMMLGIVVLV